MGGLWGNKLGLGARRDRGPGDGEEAGESWGERWRRSLKELGGSWGEGRSGRAAGEGGVGRAL